MALRESEERLRALVEYAPEAIMVLDVETGLFIDANARAEELFGFPASASSRWARSTSARAAENGRASCEVVEEEHRKCSKGDRRLRVPARPRLRQEDQLPHALTRLPAAGRQLIRATITDVTELKELQEKVRRAEKLAAVGVLAAGVAHEIGNPLMALTMAAESLERRTQDEYFRMKLALIREHIGRISRIVHQMSDLARPQSGPKANHDLNRIVRLAVEMARHDKRSKDSEIRYELSYTGLPSRPSRTS